MGIYAIMATCTYAIMAIFNNPPNVYVAECLDAITPEKCLISDFDEIDEAEDSYTDDKCMSL